LADSGTSPKPTVQYKRHLQRLLLKNEPVAAWLAQHRHATRAYLQPPHAPEPKPAELILGFTQEKSPCQLAPAELLDLAKSN
jgi:hypothetical protein